MTTQIPAEATAQSSVAETTPEENITAKPTARPAAPTIEVRLFAGAAAEYGQDLDTVHAATLQELVDALTEASSAQAVQVISRSSFLVNAVVCTDLERVLAEGDRVDVLPPFAGG